MVVFEVVDSGEEADVVLLAGWLCVGITWGPNDERMVLIHTAAAIIKNMSWRERGNKACSCSALSDVRNLNIRSIHFHGDPSSVGVALESDESGAEESEGEEDVLETTD